MAAMFHHAFPTTPFVPSEVEGRSVCRRVSTALDTNGIGAFRAIRGLSF